MEVNRRKKIEMFINLTAHPINIYDPICVDSGIVRDGASPSHVIPSKGELRVVYKETVAEIDGIPAKQKDFSCFSQEIPDNEYIIVSFQCLVALKQTYPNRRFLTVDGLVKNQAGRVIGCTSLVLN